MRPRISVAFVLLLASTAVFLPGCGQSSQTLSATATEQSTRPPLQRIYTDVAFFSPNLGLISGWEGTILKSTDMGLSWKPVRTSQTADLNSVVFINRRTVVAVGSAGNIVRSTDGGSSWKPVKSPTDNTLNKVAWSGGGAAVAVGWSGTVIRTTDRGLTWTELNAPTDPHDVLNDISFSDNIGLIVATSGHVYKSTDGGASWTMIAVPGSKHLFTVAAIDPNTALVAGEAGTIMKTYDGGKNWMTESNTIEANDIKDDILSMRAINSQNLVAVTWSGSVLRSPDGGTNWTVISSVSGRSLRSIGFPTLTDAVAVGDGQTIIDSNNAGYSWKKISGN